jgi:formimidoylglutamate deiminase
MTTGILQARRLWTPRGWLRDARVRVAGGAITAIEAGIAPAPGAAGGEFVLPGVANLHSHAFQRAMAGLAERRARRVDERRQEVSQPIPGDQARSRVDSFWTWRETMYAFAARIDPDALRAIAARLYVEMLKAGYTHVCEFHYLHNAPDGRPYADPAAMSLAIIEAAREAGIGLTLLPVLYLTGGFDGRPVNERQRRFRLSVDAYLRLLEALVAMESSRLRVGIALHSLRAVPAPAMRELLGSPVAHDRVVHVHVAEQIGEVQDCLAVRGARPVEWLLDHAGVDRRWCLVHATHVDANETRRIAASGAVVGLCPTTEANLGDGVFPLREYLQAHGSFGIGSDSNVSVSPVEELRWLEYGQRLVTRHRNVAALEEGDSVGENLWRGALRGGARASGLADFECAITGSGAARARADFVVLDEGSPLLAARDEQNMLDAFVFAGNTPLVRQVIVDGESVIADFRHRDDDAIADRYREAVGRLATTD